MKNSDKEYKILIVDDQKEYIQGAMNYILDEEIPYALLGANNGRRALAIAKSENPDIIIMDWEMPIMDGISTIKKMKHTEETKDIPVIMSTGIRLSSADLKMAFDAGASDFIRKPLEKTEFISRLNSHLKISESIKIIRNQARDIEQANLKQKEDKITCLKQIIEDDKLQICYFRELLLKFAKKIKNIECGSSKVDNELNILSNEIEMVLNKNNKLFDQQIATSNCIQTILQHHPSLTPQEIQLCLLLKQNLTSKEIAIMTFREETSVKVLRSRLRRKLQLSKETKLNCYLNTLGN